MFPIDNLFCGCMIAETLHIPFVKKSKYKLIALNTFFKTKAKVWMFCENF